MKSWKRTDEQMENNSVKFSFSWLRCPHPAPSTDLTLQQEFYLIPAADLSAYPQSTSDFHWRPTPELNIIIVRCAARPLKISGTEQIRGDFVALKTIRIRVPEKKAFPSRSNPFAKPSTRLLFGNDSIFYACLPPPHTFSLLQSSPLKTVWFSS